MRKLLLLLQLSILPAWGFALGLGEIELNSGLNQTFNARIELISATRGELDSLNVGLADAEAFARAGIDRPFILSSLRFEVVESDTGPDYIQITTREPLREPFLNFLLEASWANGRLYREYTVLLDPPLYDPAARQPVVSTPARVAPPVSRPADDPAVRRPAVVAPDRTTPAFTSAEYGPVASTDTLWAIAGRVRPDSSVSVQQMMLALFRANPEAFIGDNINGLKWGQILRIPDRDEITRIGPEQAVAETRTHNAVWEEIRGVIAGGELRSPVAASARPGVDGATRDVPFADDPELRLLAAGDRGVASGAAANGAAAADSANLALANEQLQALTAENLDLRDRLAETESLIADLQRLIDLKDDELAALQQQLAAQGVFDDESVAPAEDEAVAAEIEPEPAPVEEERSALTTVTTAPAARPGIVEQVLDFVMSNLIMVGGGLLTLLLLTGALLFVRNRRSAAGHEDAAAMTEFPDFDSPADETGVPDVADIADQEIDIDNLASSVAGEQASDDHEVVEAAAADEPEIAADAAVPAAEEPEEDLLAEVNVFLAYEHYDQAEEFVRDAIKGDPDNLDFHSKLLEVFYSSGDRQKYEEEARVLYDLNGEGTHWEMAQIMWQEMSPNRALFAKTTTDDEDTDDREDITGGGILDLTGGAGDEPLEEDTGLDFDLGVEAGDKVDTYSEDENILDVTAESSNQADEEDILDVTAAVGLDNAGDDDILDISKSGGEDLLDVTAHTDPGEDDEDVLNITAAEGAEEDADDLNMSFTEDDRAAEEFPGPGTDEDDGAGEQDEIGLDESVLDLASDADSDIAMGDETMEISLDVTDQGDETMELDTGTIDVSPYEIDPDGGYTLDAESADATAEDSHDEENTFDFSLETDDEEDDAIELETDDFSAEQPVEADSGLSLEDSDAEGEGGVELDLSMDEDSPGIVTDAEEQSADPAISAEKTMEIQKDSGLSLADYDDDDEDERTVFVPRTSASGEQTTEDEIATRLDLAKAYVELGDSESAKTILDEIVSQGNQSQRQQAEQLLNQLT